MSSLSVAIITRNEEANIGGCLGSVSFADEIVLLDSGSTDRTVEIARQYTDKVFSEPWRGSFSEQKQLAVDRCRGPWVMVVDADERVPEGLRQEIARVISSPGGCSGFRVGRRNHFRGKWIKGGGWYPDESVRLFLKDRARFAQRRVHERVVVDGGVGALENKLLHYTYSSASDFVLRMDRYSDLSARELSDAGAGASLACLVLRPAYTFFKMYVLKAGYRDGVAGFFLASSYAYYTLLKYFKLRELEER